MYVNNKEWWDRSPQDSHLFSGKENGPTCFWEIKAKEGHYSNQDVPTSEEEDGGNAGIVGRVNALRSPFVWGVFVVGLTRCSLSGAGVICFFLTILLVNNVLSFNELKGGRSTPFIVGSTIVVAHCPKTRPTRIRQLIARPVSQRVRSVDNICGVGSRSVCKLSGVAFRLRPSLSTASVPRG